jgi:methyl-accepting chemotaxis protein
MKNTHTRIFIKKPNDIIITKMLAGKAIRIQKGTYPFPVLHKVAKKFNKLQAGKSLVHKFSNDEINYGNTMAEADDANIEGGSIFTKKIGKWFKKHNITKVLHTLTKVILPIAENVVDAGLIALSIVQPELGLPLAAGIKTLEKIMDGVDATKDVVKDVKEAVKEIKHTGKNVKKIAVKKTKDMKIVAEKIKDIKNTVAVKKEEVKKNVKELIIAKRDDVKDDIKHVIKKMPKIPKVVKKVKIEEKLTNHDDEKVVEGEGLVLTSGNGFTLSGGNIIDDYELKIKDKLMKRRQVTNNMEGTGLYLTKTSGQGIRRIPIQLGGIPIRINKVHIK